MMRLCLEVWGGDWPRVRASALEAERLGFDGFFCGESLTDLDLDCFSVLAALAPLTRRIALGPVIANILPGCRPPALLAQAAIILQGITGGRFALPAAGAAAGARVAQQRRWRLRPAGHRGPGGPLRRRRQPAFRPTGVKNL